jgi:hypothetical protein
LSKNNTQLFTKEENSSKILATSVIFKKTAQSTQSPNLVTLPATLDARGIASVQKYTADFRHSAAMPSTGEKTVSFVAVSILFVYLKLQSYTLAGFDLTTNKVPSGDVTTGKNNQVKVCLKLLTLRRRPEK